MPERDETAEGRWHTLPAGWDEKRPGPDDTQHRPTLRALAALADEAIALDPERLRGDYPDAVQKRLLQIVQDARAALDNCPALMEPGPHFPGGPGGTCARCRAKLDPDDG